MAFGLIAAGPAAFAQPSADTNNCHSADNPNDPCFSSVGDILQGERRLLPEDDLVTTYGLPPRSDGTFKTGIIVSTTKNSVPKEYTAPYYNVTPNAKSSATGVGRMFDLPRDVIVTATPGTITVRDQGPPINVQSFPVTQTPVQDGLTVADFNGDGFDDFVLAQTDKVNGKWQPYLEFVTAKDVNDPHQGLSAGGWTPARFPVDSNGFGKVSITSGDVDGDGVPEIILAYPSSDGLPTIEIDVYRFSRQHGDIRFAGSTFFYLEDRLYDRTNRVIVLAGNFTGVTPTQSDSGPRDQLAVVYQVTNTKVNVSEIDLTSVAIDIDTSQAPVALKPVVKDTHLVSGGHLAAAKAGRLNWQSNQDQIVVAFDPPSSAPSFATFFRFNNDSALSITQTGNVSLDAFLGSPFPYESVRDIAIGNYDQLDASGSIEFPKTLQLAVLYASYSNVFQVGWGLTVYSIDVDDNGNVSLSGSHGGHALLPVDVNYDNSSIYYHHPYEGLHRFNLALAAGDIQGRSLLLGAPTKATINLHIQPDTILGLPPMHLGWLTPAGKDSPKVLNLTAYPEKYNAQYNFASTSSSEASRKSTSSFTYGFKESTKDKISYGLINKVSVTLKFAATQLFQNKIAKTYNTYQKNSFKLDAATVFDDLVAATVERENLYFYPVIGHCVKVSGANDVTTADSGTCPAGEQPLVLQFSGPDTVQYYQPTEGAGLEWYQAPQQPGQVFSYPGSLAQLKQEQPQLASGKSSFQALSGGNSGWGSQGGDETVTVNWAQGAGASVSTGSTSTYSYDESLSVSGKASFGSVGASGSVTFASNQSKSNSTLKTSAASLSDSTGITLSRGLGPDATTTSRAYLYQGQSYIYGQMPPIGTIDDTTKPSTTVKASGIITVGYTADPLSVSGITSGNWWRQTYILPDIALNHPQRWQQTVPQGTEPERVAFNCPVGFSSSFASPKCTPDGNKPNTRDIADKVFYQMKGLFLSPGTTPGGPQVTQITAGDTLTLQARVYNYSLANLPAGSQVHVRFYAQPWGQNGAFAAGPVPNSFAKAVFIGEDLLKPIPAFCGGGAQPDFDPCSAQNPPLNWVYAQVQWDTSKLPSSTAATYWKFWVVAFAENSDGSLVKEMPGHGLSAVPPADVNSLADIPVQTYSNNLGFYNQTFTVVPKAAPSPEEENTPKKILTVASVRVEKAGAPVTRVALNDRVQIRARHHVSGPPLDDVLVLFYDGDPKQGGNLFDMQILPRIPADSDFVTKVPFQPKSCGPHTLFVKAIPEDGTAVPDTNTTSIDVTMDPLKKLARMQNVIQQLRPNRASPGTLPDDWHLDRKMKRRLLSRLWVVQALFRRGRNDVGKNRLNGLERLIDSQRGEKISTALADALDQDINRLLGCLSV